MCWFSFHYRVIQNFFLKIKTILLLNHYHTSFAANRVTYIPPGNQLHWKIIELNKSYRLRTTFSPFQPVDALILIICRKFPSAAVELSNIGVSVPVRNQMTVRKNGLAVCFPSQRKEMYDTLKSIFVPEKLNLNNSSELFKIILTLMSQGLIPERGSKFQTKCYKS